MTEIKTSKEPEPILFPEKVLVSCVTKGKGPLTKIMRFDNETGTLIKDGTECSMFSGSIATIKVSSPLGFSKLLRTRSTNQAIVHGISEHDSAKVVTKNKVDSHQQSRTPVIARTKYFISYPEGPGVILFDHDKAREISTGTEGALNAYSPKELIALMADIHPALAQAAFVSTPSTSSCIYSAEGELLRGEGTGSHVYLFAKKASDIPRYLETLGKHLFIAGLGRIEISRSGALLKRTIIDLVVGSPERLDFVAGAVCENGLIQKLPDPVVNNGEMLDTESLHDPTAAQERKYVAVLAALQDQAKPNQSKVVSEYIERESSKLVAAKKIPIDEARKIVASRQDHVLADDDILYFSHIKKGITVSEVLLSGETFHGKSLADPLEPEYEGGSKTKAIFYWNDGVPKIHSFAHGSSNYEFERFKKKSQENSSGFSYPDDTINALIKMNKEYAGVLLGSDFRIAKDGFDDNARKFTISFLKQTSFYAFFANNKVKVPVGDNGGTEMRDLAKVWMGWEERRTYEGVVFDPSGKANQKVYNLFKGFPLTPNQGDWSLMRKHIFEVICDGNSDHFSYVMAWMARAVQDPGGDKPGVAIVLKGGKGIGKGVFVNYFGSIFGEAFLPIADSESFTGRFNMHLSKSLVVFLDEAVWGGDKKAEGKLKQLISEPTVLFEPKGIDSLTMRNYINVIIASNEEWVVPATGDERRFCVLQPSAEFKQNTKYFGKIIKEQHAGGAEAMMFDLLEYDYSGIDLRKAPMTDGLSEQVQESLPNVLEFWLSVVDRGYMLSNNETNEPKKTKLVGEITPIDDYWPEAVFKHEIYAEYTQWCRIQNERYVKNDRSFWKTTWTIWPGGVPTDLRSSTKTGRARYLNLPKRADVMDSFTLETKIHFDEQIIERDDFVPFKDQF